MSLRNWLTNGWLVEQETSRRQIQDLLAIAERDMSDCQTAGLSADWKLNIAYNAAMQLATAALAAEGYRASREAHHYRVVQSLEFTAKAERTRVNELDGFRKKRNLTEYDRAGTVSEREAAEMAELAGKIQAMIVEWLRAEHPDLL